MREIPGSLDPRHAALVWRLAGLGCLVVLWLGEGSVAEPHAEGLVLCLALGILVLVRWRFPRLPAWTLLGEVALCGLGYLAWPQILWGLSLPILDALYLGQAWLALPGFALVLALDPGLGSLGLALGAAFSGLVLGRWSEGVQAARSESDRDRRERYELESLKRELLSANVQVARMAELAERGRIARDLHDHVGHELTAAHLALKAYGALCDPGSPGHDGAEAEEMLAEARTRVGQGLELLRSTVRGLAPTHPLGLESLRRICEGFSVREVGLAVHGDTGRIPVYLWSVLEPCLKEALANAARQAGAGPIKVCLDLGPRIARLSVHSGQGPVEAGQGGEGLGLRNLRQRAGAVGGSISVDGRDGFTLVCVLPLDGEAQA